MALTRLEHWLQYIYFKRPGSLCSILQWQVLKTILQKKVKDRDSSYQPAHCQQKRKPTLASFLLISS